MTHYIQFDADGRALFSSSTNGSITTLPGYHPSTHKQVAVLPEDLNLVYWDGVLKFMPERPSRFHAFNYTTKAWELDLDAAWAYVRARRDNLLLACDWVTLRAQEQGVQAPQEWLDYRQALRDVTQQEDPLNIIWPVAPAA